MIKNNPQLNKNIVNKSVPARPGERSIFSIRVSLMRINKGVVIENENGYHFQMGILSHHSQVFPTIRTQSTTIPNYANPNRLYIYKKGECVESLTVTRMHVDRFKKICQYGYINQFFATPIVHSSLQSIRGGREFQLIRIARLNGWAG